MQVIVKSSRELEEIIAACPLRFDKEENARVLVAFTQNMTTLRELTSIGMLCGKQDRFVVGKKAAYLQRSEGLLKSKVGEALLGKPGHVATTRNWRTVLKLLALVR